LVATLGGQRMFLGLYWISTRPGARNAASVGSPGVQVAGCDLGFARYGRQTTCARSTQTGIPPERPLNAHEPLFRKCPCLPWPRLRIRRERRVSLGCAPPAACELELCRFQMRRFHILLFSAVLAVAAGTACSGPGAWFSQISQAQTSAVTMTDDPYRFQPATLTIPAGTTVTWTNTATAEHTVTADPSKALNSADVSLPAGAQPWDSGAVDAGQTFTHTFTVAGTYKYFCIPHESLGMVGTIIVE
jgi:plastocyanin